MTQFAFADRLAKRLVELPLLLCTGGVIYCALEIWFRGYTHISMAVCGAICFCLIDRLNQARPHLFLPVKALLSAALITGVELVAGCILNLWWKWDVWDYSSQPYQLFGQICLPYFGLWFLLGIPACFVSGCIRKYVFYETE